MFSLTIRTFKVRTDDGKIDDALGEKINARLEPVLEELEETLRQQVAALAREHNVELEVQVTD